MIIIIIDDIIIATNGPQKSITYAVRGEAFFNIKINIYAVAGSGEYKYSFLSNKITFFYIKTIL